MMFMPVFTGTYTPSDMFNITGTFQNMRKRKQRDDDGDGKSSISVALLV
jgi:hypothetical protein